MEVADLGAARAAVTAHGGTARDVADISALGQGYRSAALASDRDGHNLRLLQR
jgi:hypothetical protein